MDIPIPKKKEKPRTKCQIQNDERRLKVYFPVEGFVWNPYRKFPRNAKCFCDSGKKYKKCCETKLRICIPKSEEIKAKESFRASMIKAAQQQRKDAA